MKKSILFFALIASIGAHAETHTHNVYVHQAGIDPNVMLATKSPDFVNSSANTASNSYDDANKFKQAWLAKKEKKKHEQYVSDLTASTNGLRDISSETITPLIQKYPEKSSELLDLLKKSN